MHRYRLWLSIPPDELQRYYAGEAQRVNARSVTGLQIQFPARVLRSFVTPEGITGLFELTCDQDYRFVDLRRIDG